MVTKTKPIIVVQCLALFALMLQTGRAAEVMTCQTDADCQAVNAYDLCLEIVGENEKQCRHKPLFPMQPQEVVGSFVFALIMLLSNVGGIGGGGVAIPLVMVFFNFSMKPAIAISSFSIMCSTLARFFFNFNERHPDKPGCTSIDYGMTNVMMPLILIGSLTGAYIYVSFPDLVLQIVLTLLLFILMVESGRKFFDTYKKESLAKVADEPKVVEINGQAKKAQGNEIDGNDPKTTDKPDIGVTQLQNNNKTEKPTENAVDKSDNPDDSQCQEILKQDAKELELSFSKKWGKLDELGLPVIDKQKDPQAAKEVEVVRRLIVQERSHGQWKKQGINVVALILLLLNQILRGKVFQKCDVGDWLSLAIFVLLMVGQVLLSTRLIAYEQGLKEKFGRKNLADSDLIFKGKVLRNVLFLGFMGGWVAGALGLGGGVIFNPLLLAMGVPPRVSSATGMYLITFSKIVTSVIYFLYGELVLDYALWAAFVSVIGSIIGLASVNWYMKKFGRQSIIILCLTIILFISVIGVPVFGAQNLKREAENGKNIYAFKSIC